MVKIVETVSQQQRNGYDCGIVLLKNAENVARHFVGGGAVTAVPLVAEDEINRFRKQLHDLILSLR